MSILYKWFGTPRNFNEAVDFAKQNKKKVNVVVGNGDLGVSVDKHYVKLGHFEAGSAAWDLYDLNMVSCLARLYSRGLDVMLSDMPIDNRDIEWLKKDLLSKHPYFEGLIDPETSVTGAFEKKMTSLLEHIVNTIRIKNDLYEGQEVVYEFKKSSSATSGGKFYEGTIRMKPGEVLAEFATSEPGEYFNVTSDDEKTTKIISNIIVDYKDKFGALCAQTREKPREKPYGGFTQTD
ncbi:MAG: hypothetical protein V1839_01030 [archaeon]